MHRVTDLLGRRIAATGYDYPAIYMAVVLCALTGAAVAALLQRVPQGLTWQVCLGAAVAIYPVISTLAWASTSRFGLIGFAAVGTGLMLTTETPKDLAPLILVVAVAMVSSTSPLSTTAAATAVAAATVSVAAILGQLANLPIYLVGIGFSAMVGYMFLIQIRLLHREQEAAANLSEQAAVDERQRIAREVHDVIAHSLSITLLNVTGARRALQEDRDIDEAVDALADAERLGRQAMADIRRTVKVLGSSQIASTTDSSSTTPDSRIGVPAAPGPDVDDISALVDDFRRANLEVRLSIVGNTESVSATTGVALYRITQESLSNVVKHAAASPTDVVIDIGDTIDIQISNPLPPHSVSGFASDGTGLRGMARRAELLGGILSAGPRDHRWVVTAAFPSSTDTTSSPGIGTWTDWLRFRHQPGLTDRSTRRATAT